MLVTPPGTIQVWVEVKIMGDAFATDAATPRTAAARILLSIGFCLVDFIMVVLVVLLLLEVCFRACSTEILPGCGIAAGRDE
jgi:hypothetical protein